MVSETTLYKEEEFHISLLCLKEVISMVGTHPEFSEKDISKILSLFNEYTTNHPITFLGFTEDLRYVVKDERKSVLISCFVSNLEGFLAKCEQELQVRIPRPPTHVTLYTAPKGAGIGVNTFSEMEKLEKVEIPGITAALRST